MIQLVWMAACAGGLAPVSETTSTTGTSTSTGTGGSDLGPCGVDCSAFDTPQCKVAVCNTGQELGQLNTCVVVNAPNGTVCDDTLFCSVNDVCTEGKCGGTATNTCGKKLDPCSAVVCYEESKTCDITPVNDGSACTPTDLCQANGVCHLGDCQGMAKDCTFSPLNECNKVACDPATGACKGTADPDKQDSPCVLTGDVCTANKTCNAGQCGGGAPKDCSALNVGCQVGVCDPANGICGPTNASVGTSCVEGIAECHVGACDDKGLCHASAGPDGVACNDHNACTKADLCAAGACTGASVAGCSLYLNEGFEVCPSGWTFGGDWECGAPTNVGPPAAHTGNNVIATKIAGNYSFNQSYAVAVATSPAIDLSTATNPVLSFWAWDHTEGGTFDGWNLKVSINGGQNFTDVGTVTPAYPLVVGGKPAWGGNHSVEGWQHYSADLTSYIGHSVLLRFAFRSDAAGVFPGVYLDDLVVSEPLQSPLFITTPSPLADIYSGMDYAAKIEKTGGTASSKWSIVGNGVNAGWLSIDPVKGVLFGPAMQTGPVTVTVHVEEPLLPSNFAEKTFTFNVNKAAFYTSFEQACPNGWTLTGDWQCGVPMNVGPATAFVGTQCLATQIGAIYSNQQTFAGTTATSPDIDLTLVQSPTLTFRMWVDTEGSSFDGANLRISTDGGMNYTILNNVMPPFPLMVAGKPAWGGHQSALGWQLVQADLAAYSGQIVKLQFAFQSDSSSAFPGVYIDDILIN
ncbi:MAG: choice-of-anchor J domain-containing protein [Minicystis sp.]